MSYARDEKSIKANAKAYAQYRSKVKYGTMRSEADGEAVQALIAGTTEGGIRRGGFDHATNRSGQGEMGSHADEINYRINKNGTFTMDDYKEMTTMGGRVNDQGVLVRKNAGDIKTRHGHGPGSMSHTAHSIDDMIHNSSMGGKTYKFDQNVVDYVAGKRKEVDDKKAKETAAKDRKQQAIREDNERRRKEAHAQGKPFGSIEEDAFKRKAEDEKAAAEGEGAVKALASQRAQQAQESAAHDALVEKRRNNPDSLTCAERGQLNMDVSDSCKAQAQADAQRKMAEAKQRAQEFKTKTKETTDRLSEGRRSRQRNGDNKSYGSANTNRFGDGQEQTTTGANTESASTQPGKYDFRAAAKSNSPQSWNTRGKNVGRFGQN